MTLVQMSADTLDALALRLLDLSGMVRSMSRDSRENDIDGFNLHANKVNEWLGHLENWAVEGNAKLGAAIEKQRGARRAQALPAIGGSAAKKRGRRRA